MKEKLEIEKQALQQELDELKVQAALGKSEAVSYLEEKKESFSKYIDELKGRLDNVESPFREKIPGLHERLDRLKVQLALGRMESHDTYCAQREKIVDAIDEIEESFSALSQEGKEEITDLRESFSARAKTFKLKLESATLSLGAGIMLAAHEVEGTVKKADSWLENLADMTLEEIREARRYIKKRVAAHSKEKEPA